MARIDYRTAEYNTTANPVHLQGKFATSHPYEDRVLLPTDYQRDTYPYNYRARYTTTRFDKRYYGALDSMVRIFCNSREWFHREANRAPLHPTIVKMLQTPEQAQWLTDWREMVLEYPHTADLDNTKIAFTESEAKGVADRQTVTTLGKYIKRHAPNIPDHVLRDMVMLSVAKVELVFDLPSMIEAVQTGPKSCMQGRWKEHNHPYRVYDPQFGWHMAVRREAGNIVGRCLCLDYEDHKIFVRSYKMARGDEYSQSDEGLNAWLEEQGYRRKSAWPDGARLAEIWDGGELVLPYIDGNESHVCTHGAYLTIDECGDYDGCQTNGYAESHGDQVSCADCGNDFDEDDGCHVGYHEDHHICSDCESDYSYAYGRNGNQYYVSDEDIVYVNDEKYHTEYLDYYNIVYSDHDGEYFLVDDCVLIDNTTSDWVHVNSVTDNVFVCLNEDESAYGYRTDCWQCHSTKLWYASDEGSDYHAQSWTGEDGNTYHEDALPE